ncbi:Hypothetical protein D9617_1g084640 [Elsinoe fawcettii]|nr:Hypothetical protein D9617_1g084640 [Elsinoe fawcettii]
MSVLTTLLFASLAYYGHAKPIPLLPRQSTGQSLNIKFDIKDGQSYKAWITGLSSGSPVMITNTGQVFTDNPGKDLPEALTIDTSKTVTVPSYLAGARVFISTGDSLGIAKNGAIQEPSASNPSGSAFSQHWGIAEFTTQTGDSFANPTYVDFLGLPIGVSFGGNTAQGATSDAVEKACAFLSGQGDGWSSLCVGSDGGKRVLSPTQGGGPDKWWEQYALDVWKRYSATDLMIDTRTWGIWKCRVTGGTADGVGGKMGCSSSTDPSQVDNNPFDMPVDADIWGCHSGTFSTAVGSDVHKAIIPILCAAFHRGTLLVEGGENQPTTKDLHYQDGQTSNLYCKAVKQNEADGRGYCFPYDDVHVEGEEVAGVVTAKDLSGGLTIIVGGATGSDASVQTAQASTANVQTANVQTQTTTPPTTTVEDVAAPAPAPSESTVTTTTNEVKSRRECTSKRRKRGDTQHHKMS